LAIGIPGHSARPPAGSLRTPGELQAPVPVYTSIS
jgi:hypothetical protein